MAKKKKFSKKDRKRDDQNIILLVDGFNGILALVIYNFLLYLVKLTGIKGIIGQIEETMGNFCLNTLTDIGLSKATLIFGLIIVFAFAALLGIEIGKLTRRIKGVKF